MVKIITINDVTLAGDRATLTACPHCVTSEFINLKVMLKKFTCLVKFLGHLSDYSFFFFIDMGVNQCERSAFDMWGPKKKKRACM